MKSLQAARQFAEVPHSAGVRNSDYDDPWEFIPAYDAGRPFPGFALGTYNGVLSMSRPSSYPNRGRKDPFKHHRTRLNVETLESRLTPSGSTISGYVYFEDRKSTRLNSSHLGISYAV